MKHCDPNWKINCLETAQYILCNCPYFTNLCLDIFKSYILNVEELLISKSQDKTYKRINRLNHKMLREDTSFKQNSKH